MISGLQRKPLGQWLVDERVVDELVLQRALADQRKHGGRLGDRLVSGGALTARDLGRCLALQNDLLWVSLGLSPPAADALRRVSGATARQLGAVPVKVLSGTLSNMLLVAFAEPPPESALAWLRSETGMQVEPALADPDEVRHALQFYEALHLPMMRAEHDGGPGADDVPEPLPGDESTDASIADAVDRDLMLEALPEADADLDMDLASVPVSEPFQLLEESAVLSDEPLERSLLPALPPLSMALEPALPARLQPTEPAPVSVRPVPGSWARPAEDVLAPPVHADAHQTDPDRPLATLESVAELRARVESLESTVLRLVPLAEEAALLRTRVSLLEGMVAQLQSHSEHGPAHEEPLLLAPPVAAPRSVVDSAVPPPVMDEDDPDGLFVGLRTASVPPPLPRVTARPREDVSESRDDVPHTPVMERPTPFAFLLDEARPRARR